ARTRPQASFLATSVKQGQDCDAWTNENSANTSRAMKFVRRERQNIYVSPFALQIDFNFPDGLSRVDVQQRIRGSRSNYVTYVTHRLQDTRLVVRSNN